MINDSKKNACQYGIGNAIDKVKAMFCVVVYFMCMNAEAMKTQWNSNDVADYYKSVDVSAMKYNVVKNTKVEITSTEDDKAESAQATDEKEVEIKSIGKKSQWNSSDISDFYKQVSNK